MLRFAADDLVHRAGIDRRVKARHQRERLAAGTVAAFDQREDHVGTDRPADKQRIGAELLRARTIDDEADVLIAAERRHHEDCGAVQRVLQLRFRNEDQRLREIRRVEHRGCREKR